MIKQKTLYLPSGYLDFSAIVDNDYPFAFVIGGRGTGKTYGALKYAAEHGSEQHPFFYMRRTGKQADMISTHAFNPFKSLNKDLGWNIEPFPIAKGVTGFFHSFFTDEGKLKPDGAYIATIGALNTFSNFRGFDSADVDLCIYDEFIRNAGEKSIKDEAFALKNAYETINRNRELSGADPLKMICLSNSNAIDNDIFIGFRLVEAAEKMIQTGKNQYYDEQRGIAIYNLTDSPISQRKKNTALYKADAESGFSAMSLGNKYADYDVTSVKSAPLQEYRPLCSFGEVAIYKHKSAPTYYCTWHKSGGIESFNTDSIDKSRFIRKYSHLWDAYLNGRFLFESFLIKKLFEKIFL